MAAAPNFRIWVKSLLAGAAALIVCVLLVAIVLKLRTPAEGVGWISIPTWPALIGALLLFPAAF
jgi:hypothetical protein